MWYVLVALFLGAVCGMVVMALMAVSGRADDMSEKNYRREPGKGGC